MTRSEQIAFLCSEIRNVPDFPSKGIQFKDITTLLLSPKALHLCADLLSEDILKFGQKPNKMVGLESRGFIFGPLIAERNQLSFIPVRKPGKLPSKTIRQDYELEYGVNSLEIHVDAIQEGDKIIIHDDLIATGGSAEATRKLVEKLGGEVVGYSFIIELSFLNGRSKLSGVPVRSLITY